MTVTVTMRAHDANLDHVKDEILALIGGTGCIKPCPDEVRLFWNGSDHARLNDVVRTLGYSYLGYQPWNFHIACLGVVGWQVEADEPFPNRTYPGTWPQSAYADRIPFDGTIRNIRNKADWDAEAAKRPQLLICPKGCKENP